MRFSWRQGLTFGLFLLSACGLNQRKLETSVGPNGSPVMNHTLIRIDGREESLADYRGKALLLVNTASKCGFTKQYAGLEELQRRYGARGLVVMGFPCNDFMGQEPGSNEEILEFCQATFQVDFPLYQKLAVQGDSIHPLYKTLTEETSETLRGPIKWNFTKFLVDTQGRVVGRFEPRVDPLDPELVAALEKVLPGS
jgi:glutathione peroxidase